LDPVVGVLEETQFGISLLPLFAPGAFRWELTGPILAFAKDHAVTLLEFLQGTIDPDGIGIVPALLSGSVVLALAIEAPGQQSLHFGDLVLGDANRILHDTPVIDGIAGRNRHGSLVSEVIFGSDLEKPFVWPPVNVVVVLDGGFLELSSLEGAVNLLEIGIFVLESLGAKVLFSENQFAFHVGMSEGDILGSKLSWIFSVPQSELFFAQGCRGFFRGQLARDIHWVNLGRMATIPTDSFPIVPMLGFLLSAVICIGRVWIATTVGLADSCRVINIFGTLLVGKEFESWLFYVLDTNFISFAAFLETAMVARRTKVISKDFIVFVTVVTVGSWASATHILVVIVAESIHPYTKILVHLTVNHWWNTQLSR